MKLVNLSTEFDTIANACGAFESRGFKSFEFTETNPSEGTYLFTKGNQQFLVTFVCSGLNDRWIPYRIVSRSGDEFFVVWEIEIE